MVTLRIRKRENRFVLSAITSSITEALSVIDEMMDEITAPEEKHWRADTGKLERYRDGRTWAYRLRGTK